MEYRFLCNFSCAVVDAKAAR